MAGRGVRRAGAASWHDHGLVGRRALLDELATVVREGRLGAGSLVLLTGEAGAGKTSVVRALARHVHDDVDVTWGRCPADASAPPLWPWRDLLPDAAASPRPADDAIGAARFEHLSRRRDELVAQARDRPRLHVIEDVQWADVASMLLLALLGDVIGDVPLVVVATLRTGEPLGRALDDALDDVRGLARAHEVPALGEDDIAELAGAAGRPGDPALVALVRDRTGGNPLFVTELLRAVGTEPAPRAGELAADRVPARVSELIARRLDRLPDAVVELVVTASVIGGEGDVRTLAAVRGSSADAVVDLVEQARAARLLDAAAPGRWQFRHDLVRDAVYASVPDGARAREHARVLEALAANDAPPPVLARHAVAALPLFDAERAVALAARAGEDAFAGHAYEEAVAWFDRALAAAPADLGPRWRAELLVTCGEAHRHLGEIDQARRAFVASAELTDEPALLARAALGYADPGADLGIAYRTEDPRTADLLERAIAAHRTEPDTVATVLLESRLAAELYFSDHPERARALATAAVERAERLGDARALGAAHAVHHDMYVVGQRPLAEQLAGSAQLLDWARETGSAAAWLTAHRARVLDLLAAGDLAGVDAEILAFRRVAEPLRAPAYQWWLGLWSAMRALLEGRHDLAETRAFEAYAVGQLPFPALALGNLSFLFFFLRREQGRLAEIEGAARDHAATHADIPAIRVALALLLAETGRLDEAQGMLTELATRDLARLHDRNWPASWFQLARAASLVGDRTLATQLLDDGRRPDERAVGVSLATACLGATELAGAWLLHLVGDLDAAERAYVAAEDLEARLGARSWLAQAHADHARLLLDRAGPGDVDAARVLTDRAAATAGELGLHALDPLLASLHGRLARAAEAAGAGDDATAAAAVATFRRAGQVWELDFAGRRAQLPDARGLRDLAWLLARPGEAVSVLELLDERGERGEPGAAVRGAPTLDERARREIRARLHELDEEVADAEADHDLERAALARERRQELAEAVARDLGLGGRARPLGDPVERARKTVSTRLRRAIAQVGRVHPELGRHLERSIDTGTWCAYRPAEPVAWRT